MIIINTTQPAIFRSSESAVTWTKHLASPVAKAPEASTSRRAASTRLLRSSSFMNLQARTRSIQDDIRIITDNLELFTNLVLHRKDTFLEWIIILLILIEVINLLAEKLL